jgi:hypothetical protein
VGLSDVGRFDLMHLKHLGLPVLDAGRSLDFYSTYFGFDPATAQRYSDGVSFKCVDPDGHPIEVYWEA